MCYNAAAMDTIIGWLFVIGVLIAAWPWSVWLVTRSGDRPHFWLPVLLMLALSTGTLSLVMFWQMLAGVRLSLWSATLPYAALMLPGMWLWQRDGAKRFSMMLPRTWPERLTLALLLLICAGALFNSLYWPFSREDALGIYVPAANAVYETGALVELPGRFTNYEAYPILMPLMYTYVYLASGWQNEFLARLLPALMSVGCLAAIYVLATMLHSRAAGWLGALLLAITPTFSSWASSGYVDLPMAFFYTLAAVFAWRLWQSGHWTDALVSGAMIGLAAWTKNAALIGMCLWGAWLVWGLLNRRIGWRQIALAVCVCLLIAAPWYIRTWVGANVIIPPTVWVEQAAQTLNTLFVLITHPQTYTISGPLILLSVFVALVEMVRRRLNAPELVLLLGLTVPFHAAWWLFASYDPRFLLLYLPLLCVLAGIQLGKAWALVPQIWQQRLMIPLAVAAVALALLSAWNSVENKRDLLRNPFMSADERRMTAIRARQPELYERLFGAGAASTEQP
jgi:4-amino-4-deoxy-L-arabinose transferase-like glycosyltransferase